MLTNGYETDSNGYYIKRFTGYVVRGMGGGGGRGRFERMGRSRGNTPRSNKAQNKQFEAVAKKLKLTKKQQQQLHRECGHQGWGYQELLEVARDMFGIYD